MKNFDVDHYRKILFENLTRECDKINSKYIQEQKDRLAKA
jgi:hypothetical protein